MRNKIALSARERQTSAHAECDGGIQSIRTQRRATRPPAGAIRWIALFDAAAMRLLPAALNPRFRGCDEAYLERNTGRWQRWRWRKPSCSPSPFLGSFSSSFRGEVARNFHSDANFHNNRCSPGHVPLPCISLRRITPPSPQDRPMAPSRQEGDCMTSNSKSGEPFSRSRGRRVREAPEMRVFGRFSALRRAPPTPLAQAGEGFTALLELLPAIVRRRELRAGLRSIPQRPRSVHRWSLHVPNIFSGALR